MACSTRAMPATATRQRIKPKTRKKAVKRRAASLRMAASDFKAAGEALTQIVQAGPAGRGLPVARPASNEPTGPGRKAPLNTLIAMPSASSRAIDALNMPTFRNAATFIGPTGYNLIRTTDCTADAVNLLGDEIGKLTVFIQGPKADIDPNTPDTDEPAERSKMGKWLQNCIDNSLGIQSFLKGSVWSLPEDLLFWQIRWRFVEGLGLVPDLRWGERRKRNAGGHLYLHPDHEHLVIERRQPNAVEGSREAMKLSPNDWIILKPGVSANPDGDGWLGLRMFRQAKLYNDGDYNGAVFAKSMTLPILIFEWITDNLQIGTLAARNKEVADSVDFNELTESLVMGNDGKKLLTDILKFPTDGAQHLLNRETRLEGRSQRAINNTALMADTRATGATGSSNQARATANSPVVNFSSFVSDAITCYLLTSMIRVNLENNTGFVPELEEGELAPRAQLLFPGQLAGDPNPTRDNMNKVPDEKRKIQEGRGKKEKSADDVK